MRYILLAGVMCCKKISQHPQAFRNFILSHTGLSWLGTICGLQQEVTVVI